MESVGFTQTCPGCHRQFSHLGAFSTHMSSCKSKKMKMASALAAAQQFYQQTKKRRQTARIHQDNNLKTSVDDIASGPHSTASTRNSNANPSQIDSHDQIENDNLTPMDSYDPRAMDIDNRSIAERRPRCNIQMPARFLDQGPSGHAALPPIPTSAPASPSRGQQLRSSLRKIFTSPPNIFGLLRQYHAESFPSHDPDADLEPADLSDVLSDTLNLNSAPSLPESIFRPYPNENAFLLGEWFWDDCVQKSKSSFDKLINIVSRPEFKPEDVGKVPWDSINEVLGSSSNADEVWLDEPDAGWTDTSITISIPFHRLTINPGPQLYTAPPFRHRSIVSILKEKMANAEDFRHFHLEPYKLLWQREDMYDKPIRVYGELYTSPAFLEAYEEIQQLPGEPGCTLPRVLVGLMFSSDGTLLTSFGNASLWPCYMYFGNESKYLRSKPSCKLCHHIAYFHKVSPSVCFYSQLPISLVLAASRFQRFCCITQRGERP
jgi:hypothetical protein